MTTHETCKACGHTRSQHSGHTYAVGQAPPTHCSQADGCFAFATPEEAVPGVAEAREAFLGKLRYWLADPLNTNTIGMPAVERDLDDLIAAARAPAPVGGEADHD